MLIADLVSGCATPRENIDQPEAYYKEEKIEHRLEDFFRPPLNEHFKLSPDGQKIAFLRYWKSARNIYIKDLANSSDETVVSEEDESDVIWYDWINNNQMVYLAGNHGNGVDIVKLDINSRNKQTYGHLFGNADVRMIDSMPSVPGQIYISLNKIHSRVFDLYKLDLDQRRLTLVERNTKNQTIKWLPGHNGFVRAIFRSRGDGRELVIKTSQNSGARIIKRINNEVRFFPLLLSSNDQFLYAFSDENYPTLSLVEINLGNGQEKVLYSHSRFDVEDIMVSEKDQSLLGVRLHARADRLYFFNDELKDLQKKLDNAFPEKQALVVHEARNGVNKLVLVESDNHAGTYYIYDGQKSHFSPLAHVRPWLDPGQLHETMMIRYKSQDGQPIEAYLTLPEISGKGPGTLKSLVYVDNTPWEPVDEKFDEVVQFFAHEGYVVIRINTRGVNGYGTRFYSDGFKTMGSTRNLDIIEGINYLVGQGLISKSNVSFYGKGYGGFVGLNMSSHYSEVFRRIVVEDPYGNLFSLLNVIPSEYQAMRERFYATIGHPIADRKMIIEQSPQYHLNSMRAKMLVIQDTASHYILKQDMTRMVASLKKGRRPVSYQTYDGITGIEGLGNKYKHYRMISDFLR